MKKRIWVLSLILLFLLTACKKEENKPSSEESKNSSTTQTTTSPSSSQEISTVGLDFDQFHFDTMTIKGERLKSEDFFQGTKLTMVNVWGTFCQPCIKELPDLAKLNKEYEDSEFRILGIVADTVATSSTNVEEAEKIIHDSGISYVNIMPNPSMDKEMQNFAAVPTTFFVDNTGKVVGKAYAGAKSYEDWKSIVDSTLKEIEQK